MLGALALPARAAEPQLPGLNWVRLPGAESCLSAFALAARVEARVGRVLFAAVSEAGLFIDGHVRARADQPGWDVTLELSDPLGKVLGRRVMQFAGAQCSVIDEAVALVIAVTLYPNTSLLERGIPLEPSTAASLQALFGQEPTDPDPSALPDAVAAPAPAATSSGDRTEVPASPDDRAPSAPGGAPPTRASPWRYGVGAAATAGFGQLPGLSPGISAQLWLTPLDAWPIEAAMVLLPETTAQAERATGRVRFDLLAVSLALCPWQPDWLRGLALCAGAEVGRLRVRSGDFPRGDMTADDAVVSVFGAARLHVRLAGPLQLRIALPIAVPLAQHRYTFEADDGSSQTLFRIAQLTGRAELGLALEL